MIHIESAFKSQEITEDNYNKQCFFIYDDERLLTIVRGGELSLNACKNFYAGNIKEGLKEVVNTRAEKAKEAEAALEKLN